MNTNDTQLKCTWKNGWIGAGLIAVISVGFRLIMWDEAIVGAVFLPVDAMEECFPLEFANMVWAPLVLPALFVVVCYLVMYRGYMRIAGRNPRDLRGVAHGKHGKPFVVPMILLLILNVLWVAVLEGFAIVFKEMDFPISHYDSLALNTLAVVGCLGIVVDVVLFLLGKRFFKPDRVQEHH